MQYIFGPALPEEASVLWESDITGKVLYKAKYRFNPMSHSVDCTHILYIKRQPDLTLV